MGRTMTFIVRSQIETASMVAPARSVFTDLNSTLPISNIKTMETIIQDSVAPFRFNMFLLGLIATIAIVLTVVGVYGVMNYAVAQRTREIGIRMALGAQPGQVRSLILKQGLVLSAAGLVIGVGACFLFMRFIASLLFGVSTTDPIIFIAVALGLVIVSMAACYIPARKATKVDPLIALRYE